MSKIVAEHNDPMVILAIMMNAKVKRVFINQGSSANIIFREALDKLGLKNSNLQSYPEEIIGFSGGKYTQTGSLPCT